MKITNAGFERLDLRLEKPYTIAYETIYGSVNYILQLETDSSLTGWGCAAPDPVVTGEDPESLGTVIRDTIIPGLIGADPFQYARILHDLKEALEHHSSALAMVDMALFDLVSKKAGVPLYQFLGGYRHSIPTSITIGILPLPETMSLAKGYVQEGFSIIKLKGGSEVEEDIRKIHALRKTYPEIVIRFDANQGYSVAEAIHFYRSTKAARIQIFEQPTRVDRESQLEEVTANVSIPVMADESLKSLKDVFRLVRHDRIDMANIKLMKVGGIWEAMHINSVARSAGMEVMVGCIDECALGISAGLHFALSRPNIEFADLDGHIDFINDPFDGLFHLEKGVLKPTDQPGLGR